MILQRLVEYSERDSGEQIPFMYANRQIKWIIDLDSNGIFKGFVPLEVEGKGKNKGKKMLLPQITRSSGVKPKLLADNGEYVLGFSFHTEADKEKEKIKLRHQSFVELTKECVETTNDPHVKAIYSFLETFDARNIEIPKDLDPKDDMTFRIDERFFPASDNKRVQEFWALKTGGNESEIEDVHMCIVCGEDKPVLKSHPILIKNIPGGQTSGMAIISANSNAFESYGLSRSLIAPTCASCGEKYASTLNRLIASRENTMVIGKVRYVFWTRSEHSFSPISFLDDPSPAEVKELLNSVRIGKAGELDIDDAFYACSLTSSGARVVVRDWIETTVGNVKRHFAHWFRLQSIVKNDGSEGEPLSIFKLAASLYFKTKDMASNVPRTMLSCALKGTPIPISFLHLAVKRNHAERSVTRPRAVVIRMALISNYYNYKEDFMIKLEPSLESPAYHCGRLLAELEAVQRQAIPGINSTLTDRYFGTASSAPASVFGRLIRGAQPHMGKLKRDNEPAYIRIQQRLEDIMSGISQFPKTLTLEEQGLFSLGYYHQKAYEREQMEIHKKNKENRKKESEEKNND